MRRLFFRYIAAPVLFLAGYAMGFMDARVWGYDLLDIVLYVAIFLAVYVLAYRVVLRAERARWQRQLDREWREEWAKRGEKLSSSRDWRGGDWL